MFKQILPFIFAAAAAHATPAEAVEPIYVGEPTKKLARQAARCAGVMAFASAVLNDKSALAPDIIVDFARRTIGADQTKSLSFAQMNSYREVPPSSINGKLVDDLEVCKNTLTAVVQNEAAQKMAACAGTAVVAQSEDLSIGGDHKKIAKGLGDVASLILGDAGHTFAVAAARVDDLILIPSELPAAIRKCQPLFDAASKGKGGVTPTPKIDSGRPLPRTGLEINI